VIWLCTSSCVRACVCVCVCVYACAKVRGSHLFVHCTLFITRVAVQVAMDLKIDTALSFPRKVTGVKPRVNRNKKSVPCKNLNILTFYSDQADVKQMLTLVPFYRLAYQSLVLLGFTRSDRIWFRSCSLEWCIWQSEKKNSTHGVSLCLSFLTSSILTLLFFLSDSFCISFILLFILFLDVMSLLFRRSV
jgi:hypothetical protein